MFLIHLSKLFEKDLVKMLFVNSWPTSGIFWQNVEPDLDPNCLTLWWYFENVDFEKN